MDGFVSVGIMAYEHMVGRPPFCDEAPPVILFRHVHDQVRPVVEVRPEGDDAVSAWIDRLLVKSVNERIQNATLAWEELKEIVIARVGARWRRQARLPIDGQMADTPRPLTPAPFESERVRTPKPVSRPPERAAGQNPESGYVTFGAAAAPATPPTVEPTPSGSVPREREALAALRRRGRSSRKCARQSRIGCRRLIT